MMKVMENKSRLLARIMENKVPFLMIIKEMNFMIVKLHIYKLGLKKLQTLPLV